MPVGWISGLSDEYDWVPLRLPPDVTRITASTRLSIEAEYRGWELTKGAPVHRWKQASPVAGARKPTTAIRGSRGRDAMYSAVRSALFLAPPERIHTAVFAALRGATATSVSRRRLRKALGPRDPVLASTVFGRTLSGPLGLAAGFDKDGHGPNAWGALGFGYAEVGNGDRFGPAWQLTPRLFRLPADRALLNRMGFNNHGAGELAVRLARHHPDVPIGVNIGKSKATPRSAPSTTTAPAPGCWARWRHIWW